MKIVGEVKTEEPEDGVKTGRELKCKVEAALSKVMTAFHCDLYLMLLYHCLTFY